ncbi:MAG TPA: serine/threonine-protein kinase [Thermoanaerobaculia bacterium]
MPTRNELPQTIGKYEVIEVIGRGGMGVVYSARDPFIDRVVAIKTIRNEADCDDDQLGRLRMEARSAGKLQHPNIVTVFDFGELGDLSYIVMEYVQGINLSRAVGKRKAVPLPDKLNILTQVARGLSYAHECGVVHRDMKPSNICITARGVPKILDFGLARFDNTRLTKSGFLSGTIAYMSPERFSGETGPQDDIFALGAVAYEFLTYQRAFPGETTPEIISKILGGPMPRGVSELTGYPRELDLIVLRAIDRDPAQRFQTAAAFEQALEKFTRTDEYQDFIKDETLAPQFQQPVDWNDDNVLPNTNPYSSARSLDDVPMGGAPTLQVASDHKSPSGTQVDVPEGEPTVAKTKAARVLPRSATPPTRPAIDPRAGDGVPTQLTPADKPRRRGVLVAIVIAAAVAVGVGTWLTRRQTEPVVATPPRVVVAPTRVPPTEQPDAPIALALRQSEVQLETAKTLAELVARRPLTAEDKARFADANRRLDQARTLVAQKDYSAGAALAKSAGDTLRELLSAPAPGKPFVEPQRKHGQPTTTVAPPVVATQPVVPTTAPVVVQPPPVVVATPPPPAPQKPSRAELEHEINAFMHEVAVAYQEKDVAFFRQRALNYSDQLANAIRNSPSTRVDITVRSIQFSDDSNASVTARRTDTFAETGMPPGVQTLVFELRRLPDGWKIVRFARAG